MFVSGLTFRPKYHHKINNNNSLLRAHADNTDDFIFIDNTNITQDHLQHHDNVHMIFVIHFCITCTEHTREVIQISTLG